ncbi:hypothetical protein BgiMline_025459, partial [Biomphalaria glabrata]
MTHTLVRFYVRENSTSTCAATETTRGSDTETNVEIQSNQMDRDSTRTNSPVPNWKSDESVICPEPKFPDIVEI